MKLWMCSRCQTVKASVSRPEKCRACDYSSAQMNTSHGPRIFEEVDL